MYPHYITDSFIASFVKASLEEDQGNGDHSSLASIPAHAANHARLIVKDEGIIAGISLAKKIFAFIDTDLQGAFPVQDGSRVSKGEIAFTIHGNARSILLAERLVLNCMQRMSGIATTTAEFVDLVKGTKAKILDTRKTTPLFRPFEKWAVLIGGGTNHRYGLFDMIILKDNHVDFAGGIKNAIEASYEYLIKNNLSLQIEIETRSLEEVKEVLEIGKVHRIMLDNMSCDMMKEAVKMIAGKYETEASGGVNKETVRKIAETGVDYISVGALTHSIQSLDLSLKAFHND